MSYLIVFLGGGLGAALRHLVNRAVAAAGAAFPWGTLLVNVIGSLLMGLFLGWALARGLENHPSRLFLAAGVLGGFTTFSAFSYDAVELWQGGATEAAAAYVVGQRLSVYRCLGDRLCPRARRHLASEIA